MKILKIPWKFLIFCRYIGISFYEHWIRMPLGILYCMFRFRDRDTTYLVICDHIGDMLFSMGYARAYRARKDIKRLAVITKSSLVPLTELYPEDVDTAIVIPPFFLQAILKGQRTQFGYLLYRHFKHIVIIEPANHVTGTFDFIQKFPQVYLIDCIRYGILGLEENCRYELPVNTRMGALDKTAPFEKGLTGKTVVLCPYAQAIEEIDGELFQRLAEELTQREYEVFTNTGSKREKEIPGTKRFSYDLKTTFSLAATEISCFVGLRSGLLDLAQHAGCGVLALYPPDSDMEHFFALGQGVLSGDRACQYRITEDMDGDIQKIFGYIEQLTGDRV
ncbi:MAG: hypothetical protein J1F02_01105 [Lachnospiraceae bacterium]|nr:hypothetical protein [Lachnospiraceae bacterium]